MIGIERMLEPEHESERESSDQRSVHPSRTSPRYHGQCDAHTREAQPGDCRANSARTPPIASVTKKSALIASTTAPPLGTSSRLEMNRPPTPATKAVATLKAR